MVSGKKEGINHIQANKYMDEIQGIHTELLFHFEIERSLSEATSA